MSSRSFASIKMRCSEAWTFGVLIYPLPTWNSGFGADRAYEQNRNGSATHQVLGIAPQNDPAQTATAMGTAHDEVCLPFFCRLQNMFACPAAECFQQLSVGGYACISRHGLGTCEKRFPCCTQVGNDVIQRHIG